MTYKTVNSRVLGGIAALLGCVACGGRPDAWNQPFDPGVQAAGTSASELQVRGLTGSVAVLDPSLNQVLMLTSPDPLAIDATRLPVGRDVVKFETSVGRDKLFVLSRGVTPRYKDTDEPPQLRIFDGGTEPKQLDSVELKDPYNELDIDPLGEWLVVRSSEGLVSNPNELLLVHLKSGKSGDVELIPKPLHSSGSKPIAVKFTSELSIPGQDPRRLLVVEREHDLALVDLADPKAPEITIGLPELPGGGAARPLDVVDHTGIDGEVHSMLAVQLQGDSNVYLLTINASTSSDHAFSVDGNEVDVGGAPRKLDFVQTRKDGGLRLAALVPDKLQASLVDPASGAVQAVGLPAGFTQIRRITDAVSESSGQDIALLYGENTDTIAFWQLGTTTGTPYRSIDAYDIGINVTQVLDIPSDKFADRKILSGSASTAQKQFYVLDLRDRKSFPLDVLTDLTLNLSPTGEQLWAYGVNDGFAQLKFDPLLPSSLYTQENIAFVHDFETHSGNGRSALALHVIPNQSHRSLAATMFDADSPNTAKTKFFSNLELRGIK